ncbi:MAG: hypothetical protein QMB54_05975 [Neofamilia sp.]
MKFKICYWVDRKEYIYKFYYTRAEARKEFDQVKKFITAEENNRAIRLNRPFPKLEFKICVTDSHAAELKKKKLEKEEKKREETNE